MSAKDPNARIWEIMEQIGMAMIVTHVEGEAMRSRPMAARAEADDNAIYFLSPANTPKDREIRENSAVCLTFSDVRGNAYASVTGTADVVKDGDLVERIWKPTDKAYFEGPKDPNIRVIRVTPDAGEFWDGDGMIVSTVKMLAAAATSHRPNLGDNKKVAM